MESTIVPDVTAMGAVSAPPSVPLAVQVFLTAALVGIIVIALIGNCMVCLAIARSRMLRAQVSNVFIINLAITDLGCASLVMPFSLVSIWFDDWIFGDVLCDAACFFNYCFIIVSMLSLALISVDRHIYVVYPFRYASEVTHRRAIVLVLCTWLVALPFASAPPFMRWVIYDHAEIICAINWESDHHQVLAYTVSAFVICFLTPMFVMVYCYIGIYRVARSHAKRISPPHAVGRPTSREQVDRERNSLSNTDLQSSSDPDLSPQSSTGQSPRARPASRHSRRQSRSNKSKGSFNAKAIRSILVMILAYFICNTPFSLTKLIKVTQINNEAVPFYINTAASWFGFINPCCNPIIYSILREDFRLAFIKLFPRFIRKWLQRDINVPTANTHLIFRNSPKSGTYSMRMKNNITVNIINPSPSRYKRSPALIENPLHCSTVHLSRDNMNANNSNTIGQGVAKSHSACRNFPLERTAQRVGRRRSLHDTTHKGHTFLKRALSFGGFDHS